MELKEYWEKHSGVIGNALNDYLKWFDEGEDLHTEIKEALKDFDVVED